MYRPKGYGLGLFVLKMGIPFVHFGLQSGLDFEGTTWEHERIYRFNGPFYPYGGHIESIRFNEYYRMPRGQEHDLFFRLVLWHFTVYFSGKRLGVSAFTQSLHYGVTQP